MNIDKYKQGEDYVDESGCHWDNAEDLIQCHILGFCGCGQPEENLIYVMEGLAHIGKNYDEGSVFEDWWQDGIKLFGNKRAMYFFFYWADKEELTEHGGSVPGWLTMKGKELLSDLVEICSRLDKDQ